MQDPNGLKPNPNQIPNKIKNRIEAGVAQSTQQVSDEQKIFDNIGRDIDKGREVGRDLIGEGALGRLTQGQATIDTVQQQRLSALNGLNADELGAARSRAIEGIDTANEGALRRLKATQASSGVRGASATAQQASVLQEGVQQKADFEQDLLLQNRGVQNEALAALESNVQFDLDAQSREKFAELSTGLGFAQIGSQERGAQAAIQAQLASAQASGGGGGTVLCTAINHHGYITEFEWKKDVEAAKSFLYDPNEREWFLTYNRICKPLAKKATESKLVAALISPIIIPIAKHFSDGNLAGTVLFKAAKCVFKAISKVKNVRKSGVVA